jgi:hypothetical protein
MVNNTGEQAIVQEKTDTQIIRIIAFFEEF